MLSCFPEWNGSCNPQLSKFSSSKGEKGAEVLKEEQCTFGEIWRLLWTRVCFVYTRVRSCAISTCLQLLWVCAYTTWCVLAPTLGVWAQSSCPACVSDGLQYVLVKTCPQESCKMHHPVFPFSSSVHSHVGVELVKQEGWNEICVLSWCRFSNRGDIKRNF